MIKNYTYDEIKRQPDTWNKAIEIVNEKAEEIRVLFQQIQPEEVIFVGCGTSYYISIAAAQNFEELTGITSKAVPASEVFLKPAAVINKNKRTIVIGTSRSGNTSEMVIAMDYVKKHNIGTGLVITTNATSDLAKNNEHAIILPQVQEKSVVMTGSFTNLLLATQLIAGIVSNKEEILEELKKIAQRGIELLPEAESLGKMLGEDLSIKHYIYLGIGSYFGLANEGMLKMKEMTQVYSEAFNSLEFRHGPISVLNEECRVVLLANSSAKSYEKDVVVDMNSFGAKVVVIGENVEDYNGDVYFEIGKDFSDSSRMILYLPLLQFMAYYRNLKMGLNPDKPRNLNQVVVLKS